jgi:translocation and assembly module TamA
LIRFRLLKMLLIVLLMFPTTSLFAADQVRVAVQGLEGDALENVVAVLSVPAGLVREGKVDVLWLRFFEQQAAEKVRTALQPFGYYKVQVRTSLENPVKDNYLLVVAVYPGPPVRTSAVSVRVTGAGAGEESLKELVAAFPLRKGDVLLQDRYEKAKAAIKSRAVELGYLDADFSVHEILISRDKTSARIDLALETGPRYRFGETSLTGAPDYPERFLRRYLTYKQGEIFTYTKINETQLNFMNADRFREVIVTPEKDKIHDLQVPVLVQLKPSQRRRLRVGGGYGTDTGARFIGRYKDVNMFQIGHELQTELYVAQRLQGLAFGYIIPGSGGINNSTGLQLNLQREDVTTYTSQLVSAEANRNRGFGPGRLGTAYIQFLQEDYTVGVQESSSRLIMPGLRFSERRQRRLPVYA